MSTVNCVVLDQDDLLLAKGSLTNKTEEEARIQLRENPVLQELRDGQPVSIRLFDNQSGLVTYKGLVRGFADGVLTVGGCAMETHVERREDVKVMVNRPIFLISRAEAQSDAGSARKLIVILRDISAGGVCIVTEYELMFERTYEIVFDLGREPDILSIRLVRKALNRQGQFQYGCRFIDMHPTQESQVREYVFKKHLGLIGSK